MRCLMGRNVSVSQAIVYSKAHANHLKSVIMDRFGTVRLDHASVQANPSGSINFKGLIQDIIIRAYIQDSESYDYEIFKIS